MRTKDELKQELEKREKQLEKVKIEERAYYRGIITGLEYALQ